MAYKEHRAEKQAWHAAKQRCLTPWNEAYPYYGGRGITFHAAWENNFDAFFAEVGPKPSAQHVLDRIDNAKGYEPGNIRWVTKSISQINRRHPISLSSGLQGVRWNKTRWMARGWEVTSVHLYSGPDFFEACCARKSWEAKNAVNRGIAP